MANSKKEARKTLKSEKEQMNSWALTAAIAIPFVMFFMMSAVKQDPIATMFILVMLMIMAPLLYLMKTRHELNKQKIMSSASTAEETPRMKRMEERMENLEALICRMDSELTQQIEKSFMSRGFAASSNAEVSQMPTTMLQLANVLEGRYQILQEIGRGGMGVVFQAYDKQLREQVAVKLLSPFLSHDSEALERLKREVSAARRITHSNVIRIHDIGEAGGLHYVSMEFFAGTNLKDYIRQHGALSVMQAYQIVLQICDGLDAAHTQGVIHRDLKSQNIIINKGGQIKIIDFGLARTAHLDGMTATGLIMGTPEYMSPEQVSGKRVDERADIYALGVMFYELLSGRVPFTGDSAIAIGFKQLKDDPTPLSKLVPGIPEELEGVISKALQKNPHERYPTVREFRQDLESALGRTAGSGAERKTTQVASSSAVQE